MMKYYQVVILIILALLVSACQGEATSAGPADPAAGVVVVTFTSTPFLDMEDMAERTYTATLTSTATLTPLPSATPTLPAMTAAPSATVPQPDLTATHQNAADGTQVALLPTEAVGGNAPASLNTEVLEGSRFYVIQEGAPIGMPGWTHQEEGCAWLGVAGQVFGLGGNPVLDLIVEAGGTLGGQAVLGLSITGMAGAYGPGGYEIQLADQVIASQGEVWMQIKDDSGKLLSGKTFIETFQDCARNLLLLNFVESEQIPGPNRVYLPLIIHQDSQ